jgi:hypothetical protein
MFFTTDIVSEKPIKTSTKDFILELPTTAS